MTGKLPTPHERLKHWAFVILFTLSALAVAWLVIDNALDKGIGLLNRGILLMIGLAALVLLWRINPDLRGLLSGKVASIRDRKTSELSFSLLLSLLGILATAVSMMAPRPATESKSGIIEANTEQIKQQLGIDNIAFANRITGIWGEKPDCAVTYRLTVNSRALVIDSLKNTGMAPYHWEGTIGGTTNNVLLTSTLGDGADQGVAVSFAYARNGSYEMLTRHDRSRPIPLELKRCG